MRSIRHSQRGLRRSGAKLASVRQCVGVSASGAGNRGAPEQDASRFFGKAALGIAAASALGYHTFRSNGLECREQRLEAVDKSKEYNYDEFIALNKGGTRIVVAYDGRIYDVTDFSGHPGGVGRIQMATGGDLAVYWKVYRQHNRGHVVSDILSCYEVGRFKTAADMQKVTDSTFYDDSFYKEDIYYPKLLTNTQYPYNAETRLRHLTNNFITPAGVHFVRNHNAVPDIDPAEYRLSVIGADDVGFDLPETIFTLEQLKKFPKHSVTTVIQCNGNRREDYHFVEEGPAEGPMGAAGTKRDDGSSTRGQPAFGPPHWVAGAIGCSTWSGVRMRDILKAAGMDVDALTLRTKEAPEKAINVGLLAYDQDEVGNQYCCSFPFDKAIDPYGDVLVAYEMNGEPIPKPYGYPVRCIVPGHAGARNCKYLAQIQITDKPCIGSGNWKQYAVHAPDVPLRKIMEFEKYKPELMVDPPVQEMPVQSIITVPNSGDELGMKSKSWFSSDCQKTVKVTGVAWGGGGSGVNRVDVSLDGGQNWTRADLVPRPMKQERRFQWAWQFFEKEIPLPEHMQERLKKGEKVEIELTSKALNGAWNVQPATPHGHTNVHGCCVNHWFRVPVMLDPKSTNDACAPDGDFANKPSGGKFGAPFRNNDLPGASGRL